MALSPFLPLSRPAGEGEGGEGWPYEPTAHAVGYSLLPASRADSMNLTREVLMPLNIGDTAPDFKLSSTTGATQGEFQLSAQRGKNVVIYFYALDFTPV
ncbi:hypothetical protein SBA2_100007 [Acidobacteriia bacterium SbA2]|nr:hypothetical protein SBA2_100007 [Acidobacteriia bacterium SbA2]